MTNSEINNIKFEQFLRLVDEEFWNHKPILRYGQTVMNVLYEVWPEKYKEITGSDLDCFYDDSTVRSLLDHLEKHWNN